MNGDWLAVSCVKDPRVNGCICKHGLSATAGFLALLPELEDVVSFEASGSLTDVGSRLLLALILSSLAPWLLRRAVKPFVRRVATALCGSQPHAIERGSDRGSPSRGLPMHEDSGREINSRDNAVTGKKVPKFAVALSGYLDSAASGCGILASIALLGALYG